MRGSQHNDLFAVQEKKVEESKGNKNLKMIAKSNNAGGTLGGISSGENIVTLNLRNYC